MRCIVRPVVEAQREIESTHRLVSAIAEELWSLYGGNERLNWLKAALHLQRLVSEARVEARETEFAGPSRRFPVTASGRAKCDVRRSVGKRLGTLGARAIAGA